MELLHLGTHSWREETWKVTLFDSILTFSLIKFQSVRFNSCALLSNWVQTLCHRISSKFRIMRDQSLYKSGWLECASELLIHACEIKWTQCEPGLHSRTGWRNYSCSEMGCWGGWNSSSRRCLSKDKWGQEIVGKGINHYCYYYLLKSPYNRHRYSSDGLPRKNSPRGYGEFQYLKASSY